MDTKLRIVEGVESVWSYHLGTIEKTEFGQRAMALCGAKVMGTELPLSAWGMKSDYILEKYCKKCAELRACHPY